MIMKRVLKNRVKSLHSEEFESGAYEDDKSWILPKKQKEKLNRRCSGSWLDQPSNVKPEEKAHNETHLYYFPTSIAR